MSLKIIGHRGDKAKYTENTLIGFKSILETEGIDGFELDIAVSKDEELVISHDRFIKDLVKRNHYIHNLTYNELRTLGTIFHGKTSKEEMRYPTLEDVFKLYVNQPHRKTMLLEIKSIPSTSVMPLSFPQLIKKMHSLLEKYDIIDTCYIISFDYRVIQESYKQNPKIKIGQILHSNLIPLSSLIETLHLSLIVMNKTWVTKEQVVEMAEKDVAIFTWTPNTYKEFLHLHSIGVQGMITDQPQQFSLFREDKKNDT